VTPVGEHSPAGDGRPPGKQEPAGPSRLRSLLVRVASAAVLVGVVIGLLLLGRAGIYALAALLMALGLWEFGRLSGLMGHRAPVWLLFPLGFYFTFSSTEFRALPFQAVLSVALIAGLTAFLFLPGRRQGLGRWAMGLAGAVYLGLPLNYYLLLYESGPHGLAWVVAVIATVVVGDAAALLVGMAIGRHRFFPSISPKKTWEGAIGGVLVCVPVMVGVGVLVLSVPWYHAVVIGALIGVAGALGDLVESQMKRLAGVKDSSNLIPGHGGVLDRVDSALFASIVVYLYGATLHLL
jgi:phosphatidate cytidylyltransferase